MENNKLAIAYFPGCFGRFLSVILHLQSNHPINVNIDSPSCHYEKEQLPNKYIIFHKDIFDSEDQVNFKKFKTLFPYFPQTHTYLATYMNYLKFFERLPQIDNFQEFNIKSITESQKIGLSDREVFFKSVVTHFWQRARKKPTNVFPINMLDFFTNLTVFIENLEELLEQNLTQQTMDFITVKLQQNQPIFNKYQQSINDNIDKIKQEMYVDLTRMEDILQCFLIARLVDSNVEKYTLFLRTLHPQYEINPNLVLRSLITKDK
jgi:hypothetical protein|tara:strand:- start:1521 stop:2309 length:789 start_codon:yes stop_codon:yes gene_type:complete